MSTLACTTLISTTNTNMSTEKQKRGDIAYVIFDMDGLLSECSMAPLTAVYVPPPK
jgi:hypothetical protein